MKKLIIISLLFIIVPFLASAQITVEDAKLDPVDQYFTNNGKISWDCRHIYLANFDSLEFELDSIAVTSIDPGWINSIKVYNDNIPEQYEKYSEQIIFVIKPKEHSKAQFMSMKFEIASRSRIQDNN